MNRDLRCERDQNTAHSNGQRSASALSFPDTMLRLAADSLEPFSHNQRVTRLSHTVKVLGQANIFGMQPIDVMAHVGLLSSGPSEQMV